MAYNSFWLQFAKGTFEIVLYTNVAACYIIGRFNIAIYIAKLVFSDLMCLIVSWNVAKRHLHQPPENGALQWTLRRKPLQVQARGRSWIRNFTFMWPCIVTNFFIIKPTRCTSFTNLFCHETLHVSDSSSVHHQKFIHCTLSKSICHTDLYIAFEQDQNGTAVPTWFCSKAVYKLVWHIPLLSVQWLNSWWWTDELSETCRVSWQNKFVKLMRLVAFITRKSE